MGNKEELPEEYQVNLSDFALFLSVMKHKKAYQNVLSIILDEPDIELKAVKVEKVVLNAKGKRAIRLDAWGLAEDERQFNVEMQNDTAHDDIRKRSRFYQGLIDTPILKAGKQTKYQQLPPTVIIFITKEDIFGKNQALYTFEESCRELPDLKLKDGTAKLFLNMTVKQGRPELVSLLQYMNHTTLDNPEVKVRDDPIEELDRIVQEVKTSEEWENVQMSILSIGLERGEKLGLERGEKLGLERGEKRGEELNLIRLVCRKLLKHKTPQEIAVDLEEDQENIDRICAAAAKYAPGYDVNAIYEELHKKTA